MAGSVLTVNEGSVSTGSRGCVGRSGSILTAESGLTFSDGVGVAGRRTEKARHRSRIPFLPLALRGLARDQIQTAHLHSCELHGHLIRGANIALLLNKSQTLHVPSQLHRNLR